MYAIQEARDLFWGSMGQVSFGFVGVGFGVWGLGFGVHGTGQFRFCSCGLVGWIRCRSIPNTRFSTIPNIRFSTIPNLSGIVLYEE